MYKIVISGPESTGKTELSMYLAGVLDALYVPEYAREYIEKLDRPYRYTDVEHIGLIQWKQFRDHTAPSQSVLVLDTFLVITKIWFRDVYGKVPDWINPALRESGIDLFLLCYPDLEWEADPVRENPGDRRIELFNAYKDEIHLLGVPFEVIRGAGQKRHDRALDAVRKHKPEIPR